MPNWRNSTSVANAQNDTKTVSVSTGYDDVTIIEKVVPVIDLCTPATFQSNRHHLPTSTTPRNSYHQLEEKPDVKSFKKPQPKNCVICVICEKSSVGRNPTATTCGHIFCCVCIRRAIISNKQCPTCKKFITSVNCFPLYIQ